MRWVPWTPRDFLIEDFAHITPTLYYHYPGAVALMTVGMEVEQEPEEVEACRDVGTLRRYKWHEDGSGPLETALPPKITYVYELRKFVEEIEECYAKSGNWFEWMNQYDVRRGCGSHLHFRPREDIEPIKRNWTMAWKVAYDTIFTVSLIILPAICFGRVCRSKLWYWAGFTEYEFPPVRPDTISERYLRDDYEGHPYSWLAWNRHYLEKPLTLELRVFEGYPGQALLAISIFQKAVKVAIHNDFTPVLFERDIYETFWRWFDSLYEAERSIDVFETLASIDKPRFRDGHRLPYIRRGDYENVLELFREVIFNYTTRSLHYMRLASLLALGGDIKYNYPAYWQIFTDDRFCWEEPEICDDEIKEMFSSSDRYWAMIKKHGVV